MYGRADVTVHQWLKKYEIPRRTREQQAFKLIDGALHKKCNGPTHSGWVWLPVTQFWKSKYSRLRAQCITCESAVQNSETLIDISTVYFALDELIRRLGVAEAGRRVGISDKTVTTIHRKQVYKVKRKTARKIIAALHEVRQAEEVRHRKSIRHGAYLRGREEKTPQHRSEFYKPTGDTDLEFRRRYRQENIEQERATDRARKARKGQGLTAA